MQTGTLKGKVTDKTGAAIVGATIKTLSLASNREFTAASDKAGEYQFGELPYGSYLLSATAAGFGTTTVTFSLNQAALAQNVALEPGSLGDTITITAGKGNARIAADTPQTITVTSAADLENRRPASTQEALELAPSLITNETNPARARPILRGLTGPRVLIVIDGERLNNTRTDPQTGLSPAVIDVTQLASAEVVGGSGSSLYGSDSIGGTINLITKAPMQANGASVLAIRFDGNYFSQGANRRGHVTVNYAQKWFAARLSGGLFRNANYHIGNEAVTQEQVLATGRFSLLLGNSPANYTIWSLPKGGEVLNGQGHGGNGQADVWLYPSQKHSFRLRSLNSQHYDLGNAFSGPPFELQDRYNGFRRLDKYGARYEGVDLAPWIARVTSGYYFQKISFPQDQITNSIRAGSSYLTAVAPNPATFTGNVSTFIRSDLTMNKNSVTTHGADFQTSLLPLRGLIVTTGYQWFRDESFDEFERNAINTTTGQINPAALVRGASTPRTFYTDNAFFAQGEYDRWQWMRLSGGFRLDHWGTQARPTTGFPLSTEFAILRAALPVLAQNPGPLAPQVESFGPITQLAGGQGRVSTGKYAVTGNAAVVLRLPGGINPYFRWANSYREPSVSERYLIRNFLGAGQPLSSVVVGNPLLKPETGQNIEIGLKVQQRRFNATVNYFRNQLKDLIIFASPVFSPAQSIFGSSFFLIPADAANGIAGSPANRGLHSVQINGRINQARSLITGLEATAEASLPLGRAGSLNPFTSLSWMHGTNQSPTAQQITLINNVFNRSDLLYKLEGSADDVPLGNITPFRGIYGLQYNDNKAAWFGEYTVRHQAQVRRVRPDGYTDSLTNYGTFASFNGFVRQAIKGGYNWNRERYRVSFTLGLDNLTDRLYWEHFQNAPAAGRAVVFGVTLDFKNLLGQ